MTDPINLVKSTDIRVFAVLASLLLSLYPIIFPSFPNDDAYIYIRTAEVFLSDGFKASLLYYSWPAYSIAIAIVSKFLALNLFHAAYLVNALLSALLVFSFVGIIKQIDDSRTTLILAALTILLFPSLNEHRFLIIRDLGYWALAMFALWQFMLYCKTLSLARNGLLFCLALLLAASLRVEAIAYLLVTPLALLFDSNHSKHNCRVNCLRLYALIAIFLSAAALLITLLRIDIIGMLTVFFARYGTFLVDLFNPPPEANLALSRSLFGEYAADYSREYIAVFLVTGLAAILLIKIVGGIGLPVSLVLITAFIKKYRIISRAQLWPLLFYMAINFLLVLGFLYLTRFLTSRYAILLCLMTVIFVPLIFKNALDKGKHSRRRTALVLICFFFLYCFVDSFYSFGIRKYYIADSIDWLENNIPAEAELLTNNIAIGYESRKIPEYDKIPRVLHEDQVINSPPGTYLVIENSAAMQQLINEDNVAAQLRLQADFPVEGRARISIYKKIGN